MFFLLDLSSQYAAALTSEQQDILNNARQSVNVALEHDEAGQHKEALQQYINAVELARNAVSAFKYLVKINALFNVFYNNRK